MRLRITQSLHIVSCRGINNWKKMTNRREPQEIDRNVDEDDQGTSLGGDENQTNSFSIVS